MRLLFLNHNVVRRGGTFYRAYHVARYLVRRGHSVTLLTISANRRRGIQNEYCEGVEIVHTPDLLWGVGRTGWDPWDVLNRIGYLHGRQWDIIHAWDSRPVVILPALYAHRQSRQTGGKLVIDWCDWWGRGGTIQERSGWVVRTLFGPIETFFEEAFRAHADGSTVISSALYQRVQRLRVPADTIHILPQGCDVEAVQPGDRAKARRQLGLSPAILLVGFVGALNRSDAALLFDTFRLIFQRRLECLAVMIGNHRSRIPKDLQQTGRLTETGFIPESMLYNYLAACDVLLSPLGDTIASRARWPSKVNLFLSAGRAMVMTKVGDLADLLQREDAALVARCQPDDITEKVISLLDSPERRMGYEMRARRIAEEQLAWPRLVKQLEDFYTILL